MIAMRSSLASPNFGTRLARKLVHDRLEALSTARLEMVDAEGTRYFGPADAKTKARVVIHDPIAYARIAADGSVGAGEAFMDGQWDADDLVTVVRILARESSALSIVDEGSPRLGLAIDVAKHLLRRNTLRGSEKNIHEHYDLGNAFFARWLDPTMMYSAGIFEDETSTMEQASIAKLDRICRKLDLRPEDHLVEIGSGWGSMAIHAARHYGCRVTTTTISREQYELARERVRAAGLEDRVSVVLQDYRQLEGRFDKLVSIEMIEAVGDEFLETYFETCNRLLVPNGRALIQAITIPDSTYQTSLRTVDFVKKHIFPGCQIPSLARMTQAWGGTDFRLTSLEDLSVHYARTLRAWRLSFLAARKDISAMGYGERFLRMWEYYLAYCEGGFWERRVGDVQLVLCRADERGETWIPPVLRAAEGEKLPR